MIVLRMEIGVGGNEAIEFGSGGLYVDLPSPGRLFWPGTFDHIRTNAYNYFTPQLKSS